MRIVFMRFPLESAFGGAEVQTMSLMRGLRERGHDVRFLGSCPVLLQLCNEAKIPAQALDIGSPPVTKFLALSFAWRRFSMRRKLIEATEKEGPLDAIIMLSMSEKLLVTRSADRQGQRVFWLEHDRIGRWLRWNPWLPSMRKAARFATTISVSALSRQLYLDLGWPPARTVVIPNGIDLQRFPRKKRVAKQQKHIQVGCVARLTFDKGVDLLVQAMRRLPNAQLRIVGEGPERARLLTMIRDAKLQDRITIAEKERDLGAFYQSCDILVLPSREHDPFGLVAAEAMALGTPVIVTDACGIAEFLEPGTGLVVPAGNADALCEALHECTEFSLRAELAQGASELAHHKFGRETMVSAYADLLAV